MQLRKIKKVEQKSDAKHGVCGGTQRVPPDESYSKGTRVHFFFQGEPGHFRTGAYRIPREAVLLWSLETLLSSRPQRGCEWLVCPPHQCHLPTEVRA